MNAPVLAAIDAVASTTPPAWAAAASVARHGARAPLENVDVGRAGR